MRLGLLIVAVGGLCVGPKVAAAERTDRDRMVAGGTLAGAAATLIVVELVLKDSLVPARCRWCEPPSFDARIRNAWVWSDTDRANMFSNITGDLSLPLIAAGTYFLSDDWRDGVDRVTTTAQAGFVAWGIQHAAKFIAGRQRPYAHFVGPRDNDDNMSFFSGHSTTSFALASAVGTEAWLRGERSWAIGLWSVGGVLAASTAYLRIAADRHYASDVTVGALVGVACGQLIPRWRLAGNRVTAYATHQGVGLAGTF